MSFWEVLFFGLGICCGIGCSGGIQRLHLDAEFSKRKGSFKTLDCVTDLVSPFPLTLFFMPKGAVRLFSSMLK